MASINSEHGGMMRCDRWSPDSAARLPVNRDSEPVSAAGPTGASPPLCARHHQLAEKSTFA